MQINSIARSFAVLFWLICHHQTDSFSVTRNNNDYRTTANTGEVITTSSKEEVANPEPSCEELKAMWRFSKRQSRAAEITNEIPTYRDPFSYNVWEPYSEARSRSIGGMRIGYRGRPVYGRVVHKAPMLRIQDVAERNRAFEEVARLYGTVQKNQEPRRRVTAFRLSGGDRIHPMGLTPQSGSFQHLKELIRTERARELQEQRRIEEAAARNEALKELARNNHRSQMNNYRDSYDYDMESQHADEPENTQSKTILAFPDLLAPSARFGPGPNEARFAEDYSYFRDRPRSQRSYFHQSNSFDNMDAF